MKILFFLFFPFLAFSQIEFSTTKHDFGALESYDNRFVDVQLTNRGAKQGYVLSVRKPMEVVYIQNHSLIDKDSSLTLRFQVNPKEKGSFSYDVNVFTSDKQEPTIIKLKGSLRELSANNSNSLTSCPDFRSHPAGRNANTFDLTVITVDAVTKEELSQSSVTMLQNGRPIWKEQTNKKGAIQKEATIGLCYFYATHSGYFSAEKGAYINQGRDVVVIPLEKDNTVAEVTPESRDGKSSVSKEEVTEEDAAPEEEEELVVEINLEEDLEEELESTREKEDVKTEAPPEKTETTVALEELEEDNFDEEYFDPINVVFVLDVSFSMNQSDRIELMKYSMLQLSEILRPQDKLGIVTYSSEAQVLLKPTSGAKKKRIQKQIEDLKASGFTAGGRGIKLGFKQVNRAYIDGGINHVIIITDGAFNRGSDDYKKYTRKYRRKKGIRLSVVGIKNKKKDKESMQDVAALGGGTYIPIFKLADAQRNLKQAIRVLSFKE